EISFYSLIKAAETYGLRLQAFYFSTYERDLESINKLVSLPFIATIDEPHTVLVKNIDKNGVLIIDNDQEKLIPLEEFNKRFMGYCLAVDVTRDKSIQAIDNTYAKTIRIKRRSNKNEIPGFDELFPEPDPWDQVLALGFTVGLSLLPALPGQPKTAFGDRLAKNIFLSNIGKATTLLAVDQFKWKPGAAQVFGYAMQGGFAGALSTNPKMNFVSGALQGTAQGASSVLAYNMLKNTELFQNKNLRVIGESAVSILGSSIYHIGYSAATNISPFSGEQWKQFRNYITTEGIGTALDYAASKGVFGKGLQQYPAFSRILSAPIGGLIPGANSGGSMRDQIWNATLQGLSSVALNALGGKFDDKTGKNRWGLTAMQMHSLNFLGTSLLQSGVQGIFFGDNFFTSLHQSADRLRNNMFMGEYGQGGWNDFQVMEKMAQFSGIANFASNADYMMKQQGYNSWTEFRNEGMTSYLFPSIMYSLTEYVSSSLHRTSADNLAAATNNILNNIPVPFSKQVYYGVQINLADLITGPVLGFSEKTNAQIAVQKLQWKPTENELKSNDLKVYDPAKVIEIKERFGENYQDRIYAVQDTKGDKKYYLWEGSLNERPWLKPQESNVGHRAADWLAASPGSRNLGEGGLAIRGDLSATITGKISELFIGKSITGKTANGDGYRIKDAIKLTVGQVLVGDIPLFTVTGPGMQYLRSDKKTEEISALGVLRNENIFNVSLLAILPNTQQGILTPSGVAPSLTNIINHLTEQNGVYAIPASDSAVKKPYEQLAQFYQALLGKDKIISGLSDIETTAADKTNNYKGKDLFILMDSRPNDLLSPSGIYNLFRGSTDTAQIDYQNSIDTMFLAGRGFNVVGQNNLNGYETYNNTRKLAYEIMPGGAVKLNPVTGQAVKYNNIGFYGYDVTIYQEDNQSISAGIGGAENSAMQLARIRLGDIKINFDQEGRIGVSDHNGNQPPRPAITTETFVYDFDTRQTTQTHQELIGNLAVDGERVVITLPNDRLEILDGSFTRMMKSVDGKDVKLAYSPFTGDVDFHHRMAEVSGIGFNYPTPVRFIDFNKRYQAVKDYFEKSLPLVKPLNIIERSYNDI
ncbi:MAG: cysteine peptidase family C39 domain-containing protein, partial [Candidatus Omnitrophica bacterium]|nr:cysteine peptidase family C39 domain-containing protein [Candidatus Omnitrophota bacterium]